jgi:hypothetical protein
MTEQCFLCNPDPRLIIQRGQRSFSMVGLGPVTRIYGVFASLNHVRSLADLQGSDATAVAEIEQERRRLEASAGPLLLTEHGRVPVCRDDGDQHEQHCFHAHALVFSTGTDITKQVARYYREYSTFDSINASLGYAAKHDSYLLTSPNAEIFHVFVGPLNVPRQLTRSLVAINEGKSHLSDWRSSPNWDACIEMASSLRALWIEA